MQQASSTDGDIRYRHSAGLGELLLDRAAKRNALSPYMLDRFHNVVRKVVREPGLRALLILGEGTVFCAGADLAAFRDLSGQAERQSWVDRGRRAFGILRRVPVPVIAAIQGGAYGGGVELALHCDIRIMGVGSELALPEVSMGWLPEWGALEILPSLIGQARATDLILTGRTLQAGEALQIGLATEVCADPVGRSRELAKAFQQVPGDVLMSAVAALRGSTMTGGRGG